MYCEKCKVSVRGSYTRCPLCQQPMTGERGEDIYPQVEIPARRLRSFLRFAALVSIAVSAISVALNVGYPENGWWSLFVIAGMASLWLSVGVFLKKRSNLHKAIIWQVALISALAVGWDIFTGFRGWSTDFVLPILCTAAMLAMAIIAQVIRLKIEDYLIYLVIDSVLGILCILLIILDVTGIVIPALICVGASVISLSSLFIFEGRALLSELRRRLHI